MNIYTSFEVLLNCFSVSHHRKLEQGEEQLDFSNKE